MEDPVLQEVRKAVAEAKSEDAAATQALGNPLPGPLKQAMAVNQQIPVGRWKVRPLCDGDFEVLVELDHPVRKVMEMQFDMAYKGVAPETDVGFDSYTPRGPSMWQLAWMTTRPALMVRDTLRDGGIEALKRAAEDEFYDQPAPLLVQIYLAVAQQISVYWSTVISYGPVGKNGEDEASDAPANPPRSSAQQPTGSGGAWRKGVN